MIQRLQSVFLVLAVISLGILFSPRVHFAKLGSIPESTQMHSALADGRFQVMDDLILTIGIASVGILCFSIIFLYRNRILQIRLGRIGLLLTVALIIWSQVYFWNALEVISGERKIGWGVGYILCIMTVIFIWLAIKYINKDEKLVRSADRLR